MPQRRNRLAGLMLASLLAGCAPTTVPSASPGTPTASPSSRPSASTSPSPSTPTARLEPAGQRGCTPTDHPEWSVARRWDEALLDAIRRALPNPPVHARNLFHTSVAMWDAWAAYDATASGYLVTEKHLTANVAAARNEAISYAAWGVLKARFAEANGGEDSVAEFDDLLRSLCYSPTLRVSKFGNDPAAVGDRIARTILAYGIDDGSNQADGYSDPDYQPVNDPLVTASTKRFSMVDPNRWQPLEIPGGFSQNGIPTGTVQVAVDPHWGHVKAFGATDTVAGLPVDPGAPPRLGDPETDAILKQQVVEVIRDSSMLDPLAKVMIDVSPAARGNNPLGSNAGAGFPRNPVTARSYEAELVNQADYYRVMAEFWADGPRSETPPGHWNVIANDASDSTAKGGSLRIGARGRPVDRLEWDVKLYLALNGAVHNAAICAWALKGRYDSVRPISLIRYMGGRGQSSDPAKPSYDKQGLPLVRGLIELVTTASSAAGQRHQALAKYVGRVAIHTWAGSPVDPTTDVAGDRWMLATAWVPYQLPSFVTPSFPAFVSGHSTFSRAAAEVLTAFTGSAYFPGGLASYTIDAGALAFELGPTTNIDLRWASYADAADQAGQSRLFGGIHLQADDFAGRRIGASCGRSAWHLASELFMGISNATEAACLPEIRDGVS